MHFSFSMPWSLSRRNWYNLSTGKLLTEFQLNNGGQQCCNGQIIHLQGRVEEIASQSPLQGHWPEQHHYQISKIIAAGFSSAMRRGGERRCWIIKEGWPYVPPLFVYPLCYTCSGCYMKDTAKISADISDIHRQKMNCDAQLNDKDNQV